MSNENQIKLKEQIENDINAGLALKEKEFALHKSKIERNYEDFKKKQEELKASESITIGEVEPDYYERLARENEEYMLLAQNSPSFLNIDKDLSNSIPYFARNIILIGAESGNGKSTIAGNLAFQTILQQKKILMITNEEIDTDVFNRVTCLLRGWPYTNHKEFTLEQRQEFARMYPILGRNMTVISDYFNKVGGTTTTIEGVIGVLKKTLNSPVEYDAIIIDYFQNISVSNAGLNIDEWKVLDKFAKFLDSYRKVSKSPIVLLSQLKQSSEANPLPFKERIERSKSIYNVSTCSVEVKANREDYSTSFKIHKSRFPDAVGKEIVVGFKKGRYVEYNDEYKSEVNSKKSQKLIMEESKRHVDLLKGIMKKNEPVN